MTEPLEEFWDEILSRDAKRTRAAYDTLSEADQKAVVEHLRKMATEDGWQTEQIRSAQIALIGLGESVDPTSTFFMKRPKLDE